jgi:hypothetical protein
MAYSALGRRSEARESWRRGVDLGGLFYTWDIAFDNMLTGEHEAAIDLLKEHQETNYAWGATTWGAGDARQILTAATDSENGEAFLDARFTDALAGASNFIERNNVYFWYLFSYFVYRSIPCVIWTRLSPNGFHPASCIPEVCGSDRPDRAVGQARPTGYV